MDMARSWGDAAGMPEMSTRACRNNAQERHASFCENGSNIATNLACLLYLNLRKKFLLSKYIC